MVPKVLDVDGFLIDVKVHVGGDEELAKVIDSYSLASVELLKRLLTLIPRVEVEWN